MLSPKSYRPRSHLVRLCCHNGRRIGCKRGWKLVLNWTFEKGLMRLETGMNSLKIGSDEGLSEHGNRHLRHNGINFLISSVTPNFRRRLFTVKLVGRLVTVSYGLGLLNPGHQPVGVLCSETSLSRLQL
jgi:hypothetical protein